MKTETLDKILDINRQVMYDEQYQMFAQKYNDCYYALLNLMDVLSQEQYWIVDDYVKASSELHMAMMAIALNDEP